MNPDIETGRRIEIGVQTLHAWHIYTARTFLLRSLIYSLELIRGGQKPPGLEGPGSINHICKFLDVLLPDPSPSQTHWDWFPQRRSLADPNKMGARHSVAQREMHSSIWD